MFRFTKFTKRVFTNRIKFSTSKFKLSDKLNEKPSEKKDSKLVTLWKKYGVLAILTHLSIYGTTLAGLYFSLRNELFAKKDAVELLKYFHLENYVDVGMDIN
eukprot:gene5406-9219_t